MLSALANPLSGVSGFIRHAGFGSDSRIRIRYLKTDSQIRIRYLKTDSQIRVRFCKNRIRIRDSGGFGFAPDQIRSKNRIRGFTSDSLIRVVTEQGFPDSDSGSAYLQNRLSRIRIRFRELP